MIDASSYPEDKIDKSNAKAWQKNFSGKKVIGSVDSI